MELTQERLRELLRYSPETGVFTWFAPKKRVSAGSVAGTNCNGYLAVRLDGRRYYAHRLAFLYMEGKWPVEVDHKNLEKNDNRWANLREATRVQNLANKKTTAKSGRKGVVQHRDKWKAQIRVGGVNKSLGSFRTAEEAAAAYEKAATRLHGEFARVA